jgi:hypothetical protein
MTLYGYTTCTDLSRFGSFLFMGLIDIIIASLVNIFVASDALQFAISVIGVLIFVGLTAYDTQRIKEIYLSRGTGMGKEAVLGALALYLDSSIFSCCCCNSPASAARSSAGCAQRRVSLQRQISGAVMAKLGIYRTFSSRPSLEAARRRPPERNCAVWG